MHDGNGSVQGEPSTTAMNVDSSAASCFPPDALLPYSLRAFNAFLKQLSHASEKLRSFYWRMQGAH